MNHVHRLINDFKKQNGKTIWKHLSSMAENYIVYSEHIKGIAPHLENNDNMFDGCNNLSEEPNIRKKEKGFFEKIFG